MKIHIWNQKCRTTFLYIKQFFLQNTSSHGHPVQLWKGSNVNAKNIIQDSKMRFLRHVHEAILCIKKGVKIKDNIFKTKCEKRGYVMQSFVWKNSQYGIRTWRFNTANIKACHLSSASSIHLNVIVLPPWCLKCPQSNYMSSPPWTQSYYLMYTKCPI